MIRTHLSQRSRAGGAPPTRRRGRFGLVAAGLVLGLAATGTSYAGADGNDHGGGGGGGGHGHHGAAFTQTDLVSDIPGRAQLTDPVVKNPWGIAFGPTTPLWVSNQFNPSGGPSTVTLYEGANGVTPITKVPLQVSASSPTGVVFNPTSSFVIEQDGVKTPARFLFNETFFDSGAPEGRITGWSNVPAPAASTTSTAARKQPGFPLGLALVPGRTDADARLLVADGVAGSVDVYDSAFHQVVTKRGRFVDPRATKQGLTPYNVAYLEGRVYVAYSRGPGGSGGAVSVFRADGRFGRRLVTDGRLDGPWGMVIAPNGWGHLGGRLLVGNVDDGTINAYDVGDGHYRATLRDEAGAPLVNLGLWGMAFGNGVIGTPQTLLFAAGIGDEVSEHVYEHGLVGAIEPTGKHDGRY